jgi:hypothetical protein
MRYFHHFFVLLFFWLFNVFLVQAVVNPREKEKQRRENEISPAFVFLFDLRVLGVVLPGDGSIVRLCILKMAEDRSSTLVLPCPSLYPTSQNPQHSQRLQLIGQEDGDDC